ncbi:MAG: glycosyltransferase family 9 protein [Candidatus Woesearchaeota archaeon]
MYETRLIFKPFIALIDTLGYAVFWWRRLKRMPEPKKILCIRIDHIGDVLLTTPAFRALRKRFPNARIDVLIRSFSKGILKGNKNIDRIIEFDALWLGLYGRRATAEETRKKINELATERYDIVIDFHADPRNILLARRVGKYTVGYGVRGFGFLHNKVVRYPCNTHQIQRNLALVRALGADSSPNLELHISDTAKRNAQLLLKKAGRHKLVCITPASGRKEKYWLNERWANVADSLIERYDVFIVLTGRKTDAVDVSEIISAMKHKKKVINLVGKTSLQDLCAVIKRCAFFVGPDTGPAHIARAFNVPLLELFGPEDPNRWGYSEEKYRNVWKRRMSDITVDDVVNEIARMKVLRAI